MLTLDDTIAAVATASGGAARGIVRLSGPQVVDVISQCCQAFDSTMDWKRLTQPTTVEGRFVCTLSGDSPSDARSLQLPADIFLWPTTRSYTRQPMAEIHTIGSPPLLQSVLQTVCAAGARLAQPGEFTLRAFLAGRIDLMQAEAVLGVVDAADRRQLQTALAQLAGGLSRPLQQLRGELLDLLADLEAGLDFVEDDIRFVSSDELESRLSGAAAQLDDVARQLADRQAGIALPRVVLVGWPNVGKSSLFNALVGNAAALVSPQAGTTRDYLTAVIDADGLSVEMVDTAGMLLETSGDLKDAAAANSQASATRLVDSAAQAAAIDQHRQADLRLLCLDATKPLNDWEWRELAGTDSNPCSFIVQTKCDEPTRVTLDKPAIRTSSQTGLGLDDLRAAIRNALTSQSCEAGVVAGTAERVRESVRLASDSLSRAQRLIAATTAIAPAEEELVAAELRIALAELGKVVGAVYTDDLLDRIFSRFCIGK